MQTKYENCLNAGAVGGAVINAENTFTVMTIKSDEPDFPFVFMARDEGDALVNLTESSNNVTVSVGSSVASAVPVPGFTDPPAFSAFDLTNVRSIDVEPPPFEYVTWASYDTLRDLIYVLDTNETYWVLNVTDIVHGESASYDIVGSFSSEGLTSVVGDFYIFQQGETPVLRIRETVTKTVLYDLSEPLSPGTRLCLLFTSLCVHVSLLQCLA